MLVHHNMLALHVHGTVLVHHHHVKILGNVLTSERRMNAPASMVLEVRKRVVNMKNIIGWATTLK